MDSGTEHEGEGGVVGITEPERHGPVEGEESVRADESREQRPGVPMDAEPSDVEEVAERTLEPQQEQGERRLHRPDLEGLPPVFGTAQPYRGASGALRAFAYRLPEHRAAHWMLLIAADRVDVFEHRLGESLSRPLESAGARRAAARVRERPLLAAGAAIVGLGAMRMLIGRRHARS